MSPDLFKFGSIDKEHPFVADIKNRDVVEIAQKVPVIDDTFSAFWNG